MKARLASCFADSSENTSQEIERQLKVAKKEARKQIKLLVLGTAESGKSTFIKQMRIIHGQGYTLEEKKSYISVIYQNIVTSLKVLILAMDNLGIPYELEKNRRLAKVLDDSGSWNNFDFSSDQAKLITKFWEDEGIQKCYLRRNEFHLFDSAAYYLNSIDRISSHSYVPTLQDILRTRVPTSGIVEYLFNVERFVFGIVDVGGQKSERRKWIHCFENVTSIIFLAALSEYDQTIPIEEISQDVRSTLRNESVSDFKHNNNKRLVSDSDHYKKKKNKHVYAKSARDPVLRPNPHTQKKNKHKANGIQSVHGLPPFPSAINANDMRISPKNKRLHQISENEVDADFPPVNRLEESCALFKIIVQNPLFSQTSFILFLNKTDILEEKIMHSPLSAHFPEFEGPSKSAEAAQDFVLKLYLECFERMKNRNRSLYTHFTCATDTNNIRFVFAAVKDIILQSYLVKYNLV